MSRARNPPIARGDSRFARRSDAPNPGRSIANRRACSASVVHIGANAYTLSGHGLVSSTVRSCPPPLSAYRIRTPSTVRNSTCRVATESHPTAARHPRQVDPGAARSQGVVVTAPTPFIDFEKLPAPSEGILVTLFITVRNVACSSAFTSELLGRAGLMGVQP